MTAHARAGRPALALRVYADFARQLTDELGVDPGAELRALHLSVLRAEPAVDGPPVTVPPAPGQGSPARPTLAGRAGELAALQAAYDRAGAGAPRFVVVEGEAGIGKTRLVSEFVASLPANAVLRCRGDELSGGLPLQPLLDALATHLRSSPEPIPAEKLLAGEAAPLRGLLVAANTDEVATGGASAAAALLGSNPDNGISVLFAAYDAVVERLARSAPIVLVIDDVQWADGASRAWLHHASHRLVGVKLCIVAVQRTGEGAPLRGESVLRLGPLGPEAVAHAVGLQPGSIEAMNLHERSGGHPLFMWELFRAPDGELPASLRESVMERCERAGASVAKTLRAAAVLGPDIDLDLLAAVLAEPVTELLDDLEEGVRRHLLAETPSGLHFAHQLVRETLRAATGVARAALLHRQAARCLDGRTRADPLAVAFHARLGGDRSMAATALARASEIAVSRFDFAEAGRLLDEALDLDERTELLLRRARVRFRVSDTTGCVADTRLVRERVDSTQPEYAAALEIEALVAYADRDFARCLRLAEEGAAVAADHELRVSCLALAGRVRHAVGDLGAARELLDRIGAEAPASLAPVIDLWRGFLLVHTDHPADALRLVSHEPAQPRVGYPFASTNRHMVAGYALALRGEPAAALREFDLMSLAAARESHGPLRRARR